jgi:hypothetical protein
MESGLSITPYAKSGNNNTGTPLIKEQQIPENRGTEAGTWFLEVLLIYLP